MFPLCYWWFSISAHTIPVQEETQKPQTQIKTKRTKNVKVIISCTIKHKVTFSEVMCQTCILSKSTF